MGIARELAELGSAYNSGGINQFRNRIINGAMVIDQRNAGASVTNTNAGIYSIDRWRLFGAQASKFTVQQNAGSVTPPAGFTNYLGVTSISAYSVALGETFNISQFIEGFNVADLGWGTANAQPVTLSFWVRSSLTGTFGGTIQNSNVSRSYPFSYTISAANTWEQKSITITGDTTGTWLTTNGLGIRVVFGLGVNNDVSGTAGVWSSTAYFSVTGATSVVGTNGATFYITGVQLEKGSTATSFDYRPYGTELALCQRYYYKIQAEAATRQLATTAYTIDTSAYRGHGGFPVTMRIRPTTLEQTGTAGDYTWYSPTGGAKAAASVPIFNPLTNEYSYCVSGSTSTGNTAGQAGQLYSSNTNAYLAWSAEL